MPPTHCIVCGKSGLLFNFPSTQETFNKWVEILQIHDKIKFGERKKLCINHFDPKHHEVLENSSSRRSRFLLPIPSTYSSPQDPGNVEEYSHPQSSSSLSLSQSQQSLEVPDSHSAKKKDSKGVGTNYELIIQIRDEKIQSLQQQLRKMAKENKDLKEKLRKNEEHLENLNPNAKILIEILFNYKHTHKYSEEQKQFFQKLYYKYPSAYLHFNELLGSPFPHKSSLLRWQSFKDLKLGIIPEIISYLKEEQNSLSPYDRKLVLIFDEMDGKLSLDYDQKKDEIVGFEEVICKSRKLAKKFLTLMVSSLNGKLKNLIVANFASSTGVTGNSNYNILWLGTLNVSGFLY